MCSLNTTLVVITHEKKMKVGDLVKIDFEDWPDQNAWGTGLILTIECNNFGGEYDVEVMWSNIGIGWEMSSMLDIIDESA